MCIMIDLLPSTMLPVLLLHFLIIQQVSTLVAQITGSVSIHFQNGTSMNIVATIAHNMKEDGLLSLIQASTNAAQAASAASCAKIKCTDLHRSKLADELTYELVRLGMNHGDDDTHMVDNVVQRLLSNPDVEMLHPNIFLWRNFLSDTVCDELIQEHAQHKQKAHRKTRKWCFFGDQSNDLLKRHKAKQDAERKTFTNTDDEWIDHRSRTCLFDQTSQSSLPPSSSSLAVSLPHSTAVVLPRFASYQIDRVNARISMLTSLRDSHGYHTQLVEYGPNVNYAPHLDCRESEGNALRAMTSIVYLSSVEPPYGMTRFPLLNISVNAEKGAMLIWSNVRKSEEAEVEVEVKKNSGVSVKQQWSCDPFSLHESTPMPSPLLQMHNKFIVQRWWHSRPVLPADNELDATVCDGGGQCREYLNPAVVSTAHEHVLNGIKATSSKVALSKFQQAVQIDPNHLHGWLRLFHTLVDMGEVEKSKIVIRKVLQQFGGVLNSENVLKMLRRMEGGV